MNRLFLLILFSLCTTLASSQILDINKQSIDADSSNFFAGIFNFTFKINNQSSSLDEDIIFKGLDSKLDLVYVGNNHAYIIINKINYFSSTGGPFVSTGFSHFRINWLRKRILSYESFTQVQYDEGRNMPLRWLLGSGIRIRALTKEKSKLHLGIAVMFESEKWKSPVIEDAIIPKEIWKTSSYLRASVSFVDNVQLNSITYYQGGYDTQADLWRSRLINDTNLYISITDRLSFITSFSLQYDFFPIIPMKKYNYSLTNGIQVNF